jgi:hypothetical protein
LEIKRVNALEEILKNKSWLIITLLATIFSSCAPAPAIFENKDESGDSVDITGEWSGQSELLSLNAYRDKVGSTDVEINDKWKKDYQIKLEIKLHKGEAEKEITGEINHLLINQSNAIISYKNIKLQGSPKEAIFEYSSSLDSSSISNVKITGKFQRNVFQGKMFIVNTSKVFELDSNRNVITSQQRNSFVYSVLFLKNDK